MSDAETAAARFEEISAGLLVRPSVEGGRMFNADTLKVGGKVFAMNVKGRLVVKLPRARVEELLEGGGAEPFDPGHGRVMREWASVGPERAADWPALAEEAHDFVDPGGGA